MKWFPNTYKFCNQTTNEHISLLRKGLNHTIIWIIGKYLLKLRYLNMEDNTDADCIHVKRAFKDFEIKKLGEYHDLFIKGNTLVLADLFENFQNMFLALYELDPTWFFTVPQLAWKAALKVKLEQLTDFDLLLMIEKGVRGGIFHVIHQYVKASNKYRKIMIKIKNHHISSIFCMDE